MKQRSDGNAMTRYNETQTDRLTDSWTGVLDAITRALRGGDGRGETGFLADLVSAVSPTLGPQVYRVADTLRGPQVREFLNRTEDFARRSPGTFVLVAFALGFAGARLFKSSTGESEQSPANQGSHDYRSAGYKF
jgi:hypothetical protein